MVLLSGGGAAHATAVLMMRNKIKMYALTIILFPFFSNKIDGFITGYVLLHCCGVTETLLLR
jgi:hypothetical protein